MKRIFSLALCLGSSFAIATPVGFNSIVTFGTNGNGSVVNGVTSGVNDGSTLNITTTSSSLASLNGSPLFNTLLPVVGTSNYKFIEVGSLTLDEADITSSETNNLGTFTLDFQFTVGAETKAIHIASQAWTASSSSDTTTIQFFSHPNGLYVDYANGARMEFVVYAGPSFSSSNSIQLSLSDKTDPIYVKVGLIEPPISNPEPGTLLLMGGGLVGLGLVHRRRKPSKQG